MKTALSLLLATLTLGVSIAAHAGPDFQVINAARAHAHQATATHCASSTHAR